MGKLHKSLRIDAELAGRVAALKADGESEAAAYCRVIEAGADALEGEGADGGAAALADHVETLKAQLAIKDEQIAALTALTDQAQRLHAMAETKALESAEGRRKRRGIWARIFGDDGQEE